LGETLDYLSKEEVAKRMRELADNIKNANIMIEVKELADKVEEEGDEE
jgi:hypothetical protein